MARRKERPPNTYEQALDAEDGSAFELVLPLPNAVFQAIGHVLCQWAYLEQRLNEDLLALGSQATPPIDPDLMSRSFRKRLTQWERVLKDQYGHLMKKGEIARFSKSARKLKETRDFLAHGTWGVGEDAITLVTYKFGQMQNLVDHDMDAKSLEEVARHISSLNSAHWTIRDRIPGEPMPPPERRDEWP